MDFNKLICISLFICLATIVSAAQENLLNIQRKMDDFNNQYHPEYVDLVLDKNYYFSGERVWYSLYLSRVDNSPFSSIAYVEIRDAQDSVLVRQKIKCRDGHSHGDLKLPRNLASGYYKISAYTLWMKNNAESEFKKLVAVINPDNPLVGISGTSSNVGLKPLLKIREDSLIVSITLEVNQSGSLLVRDKSKVYAAENFNGIEPLQINLNKDSLRLNDVFALVIDENGRLLEEGLVSRQKMYSPQLTTNKPLYKPSELAELTILLEDEFKNPVGGIVSISVRSADGEALAHILNTGLSPFFLSPLDNKQQGYPKEELLYPVLSESLPNIKFRIMDGHSGHPLYLSEERKIEIDQAIIRNKVMQAYQTEVINYPDYNFIIPYDITFRLKDYVPIRSFEEFVREIIPQLRIRKENGERVFRIRNSDDPSNIYFFNESPLILLNNRIATAQEILSIEGQNIETVDILWSAEKINSLAVFSLADHGVISVKAKTNVNPSVGRSFLDDIYTPLKFSSLKIDAIKEGVIPSFFEPAFWAPEIRMTGKTSVSFYLPDILGDLTVEITGYTYDGQRINAKTTIKIN